MKVKYKATNVNLDVTDLSKKHDKNMKGGFEQALHLIEGSDEV